MRKSKDVLRFVFATDSHGDLVDPTFAPVFRDFCRDFRPDIVIHGGDAFDFRFARRGVSSDDIDSTEGLKADLEAGEQTLSTVFSFGSIRIFLPGNHDFRLNRIASRHSQGFVRESAQSLLDRISARLRRLKAKVFEYSSNPRRGVFRLGRLLACHGYATGLNCLRKHAETYCGGDGVILIGHIHRDGFERISATTVPDHFEPDRYSHGAECHSAGTLIDLASNEQGLEYADQRIGSLAWTQSFLAGFVDQSTGEVFVFRVRKVSGEWKVPSLFREMKASRSR